MKKLSNIVVESLLDDEDELVNNDNLDEISHTGIKHIDRKIDDINSKIKTPLIYNRVDKLLELSKSFINEFKDIDLSYILPSNFIKGVQTIADTNLKQKLNLLDIIDDIDVFRAAIEFFKQIQTSSLPTIKHFVNNFSYLEDTYIGQTSKIKYGDRNTLLSWEFYNDKIDVDKLTSEMKKLKIKTKVKIDIRLSNTSDSKILNIIFYK